MQRHDVYELVSMQSQTFVDVMLFGMSGQNSVLLCYCVISHAMPTTVTVLKSIQISLTTIVNIHK